MPPASPTTKPRYMDYAIARGDALSSTFEELAQTDYGTEYKDLVVDAITELLLFLRSEQGTRTALLALTHAREDMAHAIALDEREFPNAPQPTTN